MIAYIIEGASPHTADGDPRMARLHGVGPWQYQFHQRGTLATWRASGPVPKTAFGPERKTFDGLTYMPPAVIPTPNSLIRPAMAMRDLTDVVVSQETGLTIRLLPAYMTPRQILDDNTVGDEATVYGRAVRKLANRYADNPGLKMNEVIEDLTEVCRLAIMYCYRTTRELITDTGWLSEESLLPIWGAAVRGPKAQADKGETAFA